jgi:plastocyanin
MPRRPLILLALLFVTGALGVAGCGSSDSSSSSSTPSQAATTKKSSTGGTKAAGGAQVNMKNIQYVPAQITVKQGEKITWTNTDSVAHTVTAEKGATFDSGTLDVGSSFSFTPKKAGTIDYVCQIHPNQKGTITVQ